MITAASVETRERTDLFDQEQSLAELFSDRPPKTRYLLGVLDSLGVPVWDAIPVLIFSFWRKKPEDVRSTMLKALGSDAEARLGINLDPRTIRRALDRCEDETLLPLWDQFQARLGRPLA